MTPPPSPRAILHRPVRALARMLGVDRRVIMTYPGLRMGNILYCALQAAIGRQSGERVFVLDTQHEREWLADFPALRQLLLRPADLRRVDERAHLPESFFQEFGVDFSGRELGSFIADYLLLPRSPAAAPRGAQSTVTINVRRGDYYSDPAHEGMYGFAIAPYVRSALQESEQQGAIENITVVSDGIDWCRQNLHWLADHASSVTFVGPDAGISNSFWLVAGSRRLVLTNSTFSYWAAYVSNVLHGDNHASVLAPAVHSWAAREGNAWQHDPRWQRIPVRRNR